MRRRDFIKVTGAAAVGTMAGLSFPSFIKDARAAAKSSNPIKIGALFSASGTMANIEGRLTHVCRMAAEEINAKGGVLGRKVETIGVDPASDWPLYAQLGRQLLQKDKVAAIFGCWTSVSRKSVLPVIEQNNGLLFYPLHFEGEENSKNVVYMNSPPSSSLLPAVDYLMSPDGGNAKRFYMLGSDYVWPRTMNKVLKGYLKQKHNIGMESMREQYVPFGHSNFQSIVNDIRKFAGEPGGQPIVSFTVVGNSIPAFFKEIINQGIKSTDIPVLGLDVLEVDLEGLNTKPLVGHLNDWAYLQAAKNPQNKAFLSNWKNYVTKRKLPYKNDVVSDPMISAYDAVYVWAKATQKAGTTDVDAVRAALPGITFDCPSGYKIKLTDKNNYVWRGVFIGSINDHQGFDILWQSKDTPEPVPMSPYAV